MAVEIPLNAEQLQRYQRLAEGSNLRMTVTLDLGTGGGAQTFAWTAAQSALKHKLVEKVEIGEGRIVFGLVRVTLLTLHGSATGVAKTILAIHGAVVEQNQPAKKK